MVRPLITPHPSTFSPSDISPNAQRRPCSVQKDAISIAGTPILVSSTRLPASPFIANNALSPPELPPDDKFLFNGLRVYPQSWKDPREGRMFSSQGRASGHGKRTESSLTTHVVV
jgi:hypothetical protein